MRYGKIPALFRKFAIPGVIGLLCVGLQTIIDGIIVGNYVGANALASVSITLPCYVLISAVAIIVGIGSQTLVSIHLGAQRHRAAADAMASALIFLIGFSVIMSSALFIFAPQIVGFFGADASLAGGSVEYLHALIPFFPFICVMFFDDYMFKATGRPIYSMVIMSAIVALNIALDFIFVGYLGWGVAGAGYATGIAFTVGTAFGLPIIIRPRKTIVNIWQGRFKWRLVGRMFYNGSSEGISELSAGITTMLFNISLMHYVGGVGVAAFTALNYVFFLGCTLFLGISDGIIPIISYNFGAKQWKRIGIVLWLAIRTNFAIGLLLFTALTLFGEQIVSIFFSSNEKDVIAMAVKGSSIYAMGYLFVGFNILGSSYFTALSNAKVSVIISALRGLILETGAILLLPLWFTIDSIWYAVPLAEFITAIVAALLVYRSIKGSRATL